MEQNPGQWIIQLIGDILSNKTNKLSKYINWSESGDARPINMYRLASRNQYLLSNNKYKSRLPNKVEIILPI